MVHSRDRAQQPQGSSSKMTDTHTERKKERDERTGGAQREPKGSESAPPAMVIIWIVTDTYSFLPEAGQGQTVSPWGERKREKERWTICMHIHSIDRLR